MAALARSSRLAISGGRRTGLLDPVQSQVETTLFRALASLRFVVAAYAVVLNALRWREFDHPVAGWLVVGVIVAWTFFAAWAYDAPRRRGLPLLLADFGVTAATLLSTPYVQSDAMLERHASTMPSFWVMAAVLAWAVVKGWPGGIVAAVVMSLLDLTGAHQPDRHDVGQHLLAAARGRDRRLLRRADPGGDRGPGRGGAGRRRRHRAGQAGAGGARRGSPGAGAGAAAGCGDRRGGRRAGSPGRGAGGRAAGAGARRRRCRALGRRHVLRRPGGGAGPARLTHGHRLGVRRPAPAAASGRGRADVRRTCLPGQRRAARRAAGAGLGARRGGRWAGRGERSRRRARASRTGGWRRRSARGGSASGSPSRAG